ncbi:MAG: asparagine synthase (glutamine-hydrolyzing), partial [Planctomycetota bacterium]|nr:asparagine synthase (glutamine-hydrolyzing) [Planctomycetota bacterium]
MSAAIAHRGPDQQGQLALGPAGLAHRRLRIIDLDGGKQPMSSPDGQVALVFNGEIYNFKELVHELRALGHTLSGKSDTEVLLAAYLAWGEACVDRLNGMFAFAVYDARTNKVFAARDRFGEKPFYFTQTNDAIYLASELKALVAGGVVEPVLDRVALYGYFTMGYVSGPRTVYAGVHRLQPGHALRIIDGQLSTWRYWSPPEPSGEIDNERDAIARTLDLLHDSLRLRLVSDVPLGFFLSGGIDSSAVVAVAHDLLGSNLDTFTIGFDVASHDERPHASYVAKRFGTRHREFVLRPESTSILEDLAWHLDEPFADESALATWFLSRMTREHVTVAMSGDGGDELFAGYDVYKAHILSERVRMLPAPLRQAAVAALRATPAHSAGARSKLQKLARNIEDAGLEAAPRFIAKQQTIFRPELLAGASPALAPACNGATDRLLVPELFDPRLHPLDAIAAWQRGHSLVDDMLVKVDRTSMAFALEVRT